MKCLKCNVESGTYKYCEKCFDKYQKEQSEKSNAGLSELRDLIEKCNWNFGGIQKWLKLSLLNQLETTKHKQGLTQIQQAMFKELENGLEKDLKQLRGIKVEQEK